MILRFCSGSLTPASLPRNRSLASTTRRSALNASLNSDETWAASFARCSPVSTKMQVRRGPIAFSTSAAATDESTPPDSPQTARPCVPTFAEIAATASLTKPAIVQLGSQPQMRNRKFARISPPRGVCATSGWNCTPQNLRAGAATAAAGQFALSPTISKPSGSASTRSPCDIQTGISSPAVKPWNRSLPPCARAPSRARTRAARPGSPCRRRSARSAACRSRCRGSARPARRPRSRSSAPPGRSRTPDRPTG